MPGKNIRPGVARLFDLALRRKSTRLESDANTEIEFHLQEREQQLVANGMSESEARLEARRRFGDIDDARSSFVSSSTRVEQHTAHREFFTGVWQDIRFAFRSLRRSPSFVAIAVVCLTLGIGANVAIFAIVDGVLIKPLPYGNPAALVRVWSEGVVPSGVFEIVKRESQSFAMLEGAEGGREASLSSNGAPARVTVSQTTAGLFTLLGVPPVIGRVFAPDANEASTNRTAILAYAFWQRQFGGDSTIVGRTVQIDGLSTTIIGVMPRQFAFPAASVELWTPAKFDRRSTAYWWSTYFALVGRLKPGVSAEQARAEAALVFPNARAAFPMRMPDEWGRNVDVAPLGEAIVKSARPTIVLLYAAVALVLLVACVNVAALYLGRTLLRDREIAVRTALGAGRARIARLLLTESALLAGTGALSGLVCAWFLLRGLVAVLPADTPRAAEIAIGGRAVMLTVLLSAATAIVFGMIPLFRTSDNVSAVLRSDSRAGSSRLARRASYLLAVAQVSLAVTLVTSAGLLIKSLWKLQQAELGFSTTNIVASTIPIPSFPNDTAGRATQFYATLLEQARELPGVQVAAMATSLPFGDGIQTFATEVEAHPTPAGSVPPLPQVTGVSSDYFRTLRVPLIAGRLLEETDREGGVLVGLVDEVGARTMWPEGNAVGQRVRFVWSKDWITIVGVVGNVKRDSLNSTPAPSLYLPARQTFARPMRLIVQTDASPEAIGSVIRQTVARIDGTVPVGEVRLLSEIVNGSAARERFAALLLASFGIVALLLGAVGIYGVVSASVARRTREIGVRMALGASKSTVLRSVLAQSLAISAAGVLLGVIGAIASVSLLRSLLADVSVLDVPVIGTVVVLLSAVSVAAALAPALKASRVDPLAAIRAE